MIDMPEYIINDCHHRPDNIIFIGSVVKTSRPRWSVVQWRQTGGGACGKKCVMNHHCTDELMIIDKEAGRWEGKKNETEQKCSESCPIVIAITRSPLGEDHLSQRKKAGRVEAKETSRESWGLNYFEKFGAHHVGCVGGDVNDGGDVEENHDLPCNLSIDWNATNSSTRTATNNILSCYYCGFLFFSTSFTCSGFRISFGFMDILLTLYECSTEYLTTQEVGFV